jgi:hypothetical protein
MFRAKTVEGALLAFRLPALADIAAMKQDPMVGIGALEFFLLLFWKVIGK